MLKLPTFNFLMIFIIFLGAIFVFSPNLSQAQELKGNTSNEVADNTSQPSSLSTNRPPDGLTAEPPLVTDNRMVDYDYLSSKEFVLTISLMVFFICIFILKFLLLKKSVNVRGRDVINNFELTMIIAATVIIIAAGFDAKQIAPAMGLFGTVAGYLLGNSRTNSEKGRNT